MIKMNSTTKYTVALALILGLFLPIANTSAATSSTTPVLSGWVPYWAGEKGTDSAIENIDYIDAIHPFIYTIKSDGTLYANADLKKGVWDDMLDEAKKEKVEIIPTIMNSNGDFMHALLSDEDSMEDHVDEIVKMVKRGRYAGVDIDYEAKKAPTREYFADFLEELEDELGSKLLVCTIEARTPPESLYNTIPTNLEYANDYKAIGKYCDRVQLMTYDQGRADLRLNASKSGAPYIPIADIDWVRKVAELAVKDIPKEKIMLGVATYGFDYEVTVSPNWFKSYKKNFSITQDYAEKTAITLGTEVYRNKAGEASFSYAGYATPVFDSSIVIPAGTPPGEKVAAQALAYANKTGKTVTFNTMWWSDAEAIQDKIDLASELGLRGVAMFKIDGNEDPDIWENLK